MHTFGRRQWHPTPVLLPGKSHGQRSLVGCSPWGHSESGMTEWLHFHFSLSCIGEGNGSPLQCSCLENTRDGAAWWAAVHGVTQSQTRLKWLSSSSIHTSECPLDCKEIQPVHSRGDQPWVFFGRNDAEAETPVLWPPHEKSWLIGKDSNAGRDWGQKEKGMTEDEMAGWHHRLSGLEFEWIPGVGDGHGGLACCDSWGRKESDTTEQLNWTVLIHILWFYPLICFYIHPFNHGNIILRVSSFEQFWVVLDFFSFVCYKFHKMTINFSEIYIKISYPTRKKYTDA